MTHRLSKHNVFKDNINLRKTMKLLLKHERILTGVNEVPLACASPHQCITLACCCPNIRLGAQYAPSSGRKAVLLLQPSMSLRVWAQGIETRATRIPFLHTDHKVTDLKVTDWGRQKCVKIHVCKDSQWRAPGWVVTVGSHYRSLCTFTDEFTHLQFTHLFTHLQICLHLQI